MQKVLLLILDGCGYRQETKGNLIKQAKTPVLDQLWKTQPHTLLQASDSAVGLPKGFMGNSEVGHLTLGAGRIIGTDLLRINRAIKNGSFFKNKALLEAVDYAAKKHQKLHLLGLLSDSGVHSHISHLFALLKLAKRRGVKEVYVHAFLDGRDTPPKSAAKYIKSLQQEMKKIGLGKLASMMGRFYAMDRDNRWGREHKAYDCMVNCKGRHRTDPLAALQEAYDKGETDEFIKPTIFGKTCVVDEDDSIIFFNFRSDRARELTRAFVVGKFNHFKRRKILGLKFTTLTQYEVALKVPVAFPPLMPQQTLGEVIAEAGYKQLRLAETEKWAHVTYFFNGLCECIFPYENRIHLRSRMVTTYDKTPKMKTEQITQKLLQDKDNYDFFVVNFANCDMLGHTGNIAATKQGIEFMDQQIGRIVKEFNGLIFITADHGNAEDMRSSHLTSHTTNPVPMIVVNGSMKLKKGGLADVAPTILKVMKLQKPKEMTGKSLF